MNRWDNDSECEKVTITRGAVFSDDGRHRIELTRSWRSDQGHYALTYVMLNPSTAGADKDDPTVRRCVGLARANGFSSITVVNLFTLIAADPQSLLAELGAGRACNVPDGYGGLGGSDAAIRDAMGAWRVCAAWGAHGGHPLVRPRVEEVARFLPRFPPERLVCLGLTAHGQPRHPLFVSSEQKLMRYTPGEC